MGKIKEYLFKRALVFILNMLIKWDSYIFSLFIKNDELLLIADGVTDRLLAYLSGVIQDSKKTPQYIIPKLETYNYLKDDPFGMEAKRRKYRVKIRETK